MNKKLQLGPLLITVLISGFSMYQATQSRSLRKETEALRNEADALFNETKAMLNEVNVSYQELKNSGKDE